MPLICDTLAGLNDSGDLSVKQLEDALVLAPRSGYPFFSRRILDAHQLRLLFRATRSETAQRAILGYLTNGTAWVVEHVAASADINGDGDINTDDIVDGAIQAMQELTAALEAAHAQGRMSRVLRDAPQITARLNAVITAALTMRRVVDHLAPKPPRSA